MRKSSRFDQTTPRLSPPEPDGAYPDRQAILNRYPRRVTRRKAADIVTEHYFTTSHRSLEVAALTWLRLNGYAHCETAELLDWAEAKLAAATPIRGGKRRSGGPTERVSP